MQIDEIFDSIQGEGRLTGTPMTFIRTFGCNLSCPWCDTPQKDYQELSIEDIVAKCSKKWVCLTGGEPTIQPEYPRLTASLQTAGHKVALETNGLVCPEVVFDWLCVSPKEPFPSDLVLAKANEVKLLVGSGFYNVEDILADDVWWLPKATLLPVWGPDYQDNLGRALELCMEYQVQLTVQLCKYLGIK